MDEKTRELRDIFLDVAEEGTVTEHQEPAKGTLADEAAVDDRLAEVVESMRDRYDFRTSLDTESLLTVVRGFYADRTDAEIADEMGGEPVAETVTRARIDLHLVTDRDRDAPFDLEDLREGIQAGRTNAALAGELDVSESTVRRYRHVLEAERERRAANDRYREAFERPLGDRDLAERLTEDVRETGLEDATEGMETNVSF